MKNINKLLILPIIVTLASCSGSKTTNSSGNNNNDTPIHSGETSTNPIAPNFDLYDPTVIKANDGFYYAYFVEASLNLVGGSKQHVNAPIFKSTDMVSWKYAGDVFEDPTGVRWDGAEGLSIWSPEISYINGKYVYYYSLGMMGFVGDTRKNGIGVAYSDSPTGPWTLQGKLIDGYSVSNWDAIDPSVVVADNGKVYMYYGNYDGIYYVELTSDGLSVKGAPTLVAGEPTTAKQLVSGHSPVDTMEDYTAPCVKKINGSWYMFLSTGAWHSEYAQDGYDYHEVVFKSNNPTGPWKDSKNRTSLIRGNGDVVCENGGDFLYPGNGHIIEDEGHNYYIYCQAYNGSLDNGRVLVMDQLKLDDGMPHTEGNIINKTFEKPYVTQKEEKPEDKNKIDVILMAGQSNMEGFTQFTNLNQYCQDVGKDPDQYTTGYKNSFISFCSEGDNASNTSDYYTPKFVSTKMGQGRNMGCFGPEVGFAEKYTESSNNKVALIKYALGGTIMDNVDEWRPHSLGGRSNNLLSRMISYSKDALELLEFMKYKPTIKAVLWMQGENDATTYEKANKYQERLEALIEEFRTEFVDYALNGDGNNISFVDAAISSTPWQYYDVVNTAKKNVADLKPNNFYINTNDGEGGLNLTKGSTLHGGGDDYHYNIDSMISLGQMYAEVLLGNGKIE